MNSKLVQQIKINVQAALLAVQLLHGSGAHSCHA
jgi:hypothetical protein